MTKREKAFKAINAHASGILAPTGLDLHDCPDTPEIMNMLDHLEEIPASDWSHEIPALFADNYGEGESAMEALLFG